MGIREIAALRTVALMLAVIADKQCVNEPESGPPASATPHAPPESSLNVLPDWTMIERPTFTQTPPRNRPPRRKSEEMLAAMPCIKPPRWAKGSRKLTRRERKAKRAHAAQGHRKAARGWS